MNFKDEEDESNNMLPPKSPRSPRQRQSSSARNSFSYRGTESEGIVGQPGSNYDAENTMEAAAAAINASSPSPDATATAYHSPYFYYSASPHGKTSLKVLNCSYIVFPTNQL